MQIDTQMYVKAYKYMQQHAVIMLKIKKVGKYIQNNGKVFFGMQKLAKCDETC